jgi:hypothetical protein
MSFESSDISTVFMKPQIGLETTPGTAVAALKTLQSIGIRPAIQAEVQKFAPMGHKFDTLALLGKEWAQAGIDGFADYNELTYLLASIISKVSPTGAGDAKTWTMGMNDSLPDEIGTYTLEYGSYLRAHRFTYGHLTALGLAFTRDNVSVSGTMIGRQIEDDLYLSTNQKYSLTADATPPTAGTFTLTVGAEETAGIAYDASVGDVEDALEALSTVGAGNVVVTAASGNTGAGDLTVGGNIYYVEFIKDLGQQAVIMTGDFTTSLTAASSIALAEETAGAAPTSADQQPILGNQVSVYLADTYAGLAGASALTRALSANFDISDRFGQLWALNRSNGSWAVPVEKKPQVQMKLKLEADDTGMDLLSYMRQGTKKFIRIECVGPLISGSDYYGFDIDMCGKVGEISDFSDEDGIYAIEWTFNANYDSTWTKALELTLVNKLASL